MMRLESIKGWARAIKLDVVALWIAARDHRTPIVAKVVAAAVATYAQSPIDLIPDFIPVLGYVDDLLIVPAGIILAIKLVPAALLAEFREKAMRQALKPNSYAGLAIVVAIWLAAAALIFWGMSAIATVRIANP